jgi:hypothetical protein
VSAAASLFVSAVALAANASVTFPLRALPSPLYGGDFWYQLGQTSYVLRGGNPLGSGSIPGSLPGYLPLYSTIAGTIGRALGCTAIQAELGLSYGIAALGAAAMFALMLEIFESPLVAVAGTLLHVSRTGFPILKYTDFTRFLMIPLLLWFLARFWKRADAGRAIALGVVYGLVGLSHGVAFIAISLFLAAACIFDCSRALRSAARLPRLVGLYVLVCAVGVAIALPYWYRPIFVHHGQTSPHYLDWNSEDWASAAHRAAFAWSTLRRLVASFGSAEAAAGSVLVVLGLTALAARSGSSFARRFIAFSGIASAGLVLHAFLTEPLLHTHFVPDYVAYLLLDPVVVLLSALGLAFVASFMSRRRARLGSAVIAVAVSGLLFLTVQSSRARAADPWHRVASERPLPEHLSAVTQYLDEHAPLDAVILTSKELGFALNALSGRKLVVARRAQMDPYQPLDAREVDAAIAFYGRNTAAKREILARYGVRYLYWDRQWIPQEYAQTEAGIVPADPLLALDEAQWRRPMDEHGVMYDAVTTWVDPAMRGPKYKQLPVLLVSPANYVEAAHPWRPDLDIFLRQVWSFDDAGGPVAALYEVALP